MANILAVAAELTPTDLEQFIDSMPPGYTSRVFFDVCALPYGEYVLVIETRDVPGLLLTISSTLGRLDLDIVQSEIRTTGGIARDRFQIEPLEGAFDDARLAEIGRRVMSAIQMLHAQHGLDRR
jgi:hypothetical protein